LAPKPSQFVIYSGAFWKLLTTDLHPAQNVCVGNYNFRCAYPDFSRLNIGRRLTTIASREITALAIAEAAAYPSISNPKPFEIAFVHSPEIGEIPPTPANHLGKSSEAPNVEAIATTSAAASHSDHLDSSPASPLETFNPPRFPI
jgi:hypothetical protein